MELGTKPDADKALERWEAWWHCEIIDRPVVTISVRPEHPPASGPAPEKHESLRQRWFDMERAIDCFEAGLDGAVFLAESFPVWYPNLGPEVAATVYGCELDFGERTSWSHPIAQSCREILTLQPDLTDEYWSCIRAATEMSVQRGKGRWLTGITDLHSNVDLLAALRDPQALCLEYCDDLETVKRAAEHVKEVFGLLFDDLWKPIEAAGQPCTSWHGALHQGRQYVLSCDFICLISPEMFAETVLPSLLWEADFVERSVYHVDGPEALRHLDAICSVERVHGIQWIYGAGNGAAGDWIDVYRRIQAAGKCIQIVCRDLNDAKAVAEHLRPEGVWFSIGGSYAHEEAEDFLRWTQRWAAGKE